jgi:N-acetylglucosamine-6-phosphate deacetylase
LYGPYFAPDKVGCHLPEQQRTPRLEEYRDYFSTGMVRIATCAAELPGAAAFYRYAKKHDCLITCGHSNSTYTEMQAAFAAGMRHVDHFWCAMSSVSSLRGRCGVPMQASMEQFVLMEPEMSTEVIADGCHLSDDLLRFAWRFKGPERLCLVTDASRALDQPAGEYRFGSAIDGPVFRSDGQVGWTLDGRSLASSVAGMDRMVRNMLRATGAAVPEVIRMASLTPAERAGIADQVGSIESGKRADLVLWSPRLHVKSVMLAGRWFARLPG